MLCANANVRHVTSQGAIPSPRPGTMARGRWPDTLLDRKAWRSSRVCALSVDARARCGSLEVTKESDTHFANGAFLPSAKLRQNAHTRGPLQEAPLSSVPGNCRLAILEAERHRRLLLRNQLRIAEQSTSAPVKAFDPKGGSPFQANVTSLKSTVVTAFP
jgi:hypothetical protein